MKRLILATIFTLIACFGYLATDGVVLASMDQTILKLMVAKIVVVSLFLIYTIFVHVAKSETK